MKWSFEVVNTLFGTDHIFVQLRATPWNLARNQSSLRRMMILSL